MRRGIWRAAVFALSLAAGVAGTTATPRTALGANKTKIQWVKVDVPDGDDAARVQKLLKKALGEASKRADFGKTKSVALTARVVELTTETRGDVLRITCTVMGRIVGGAGARSKISYGGSPEQRAELEKEVLTQVARGLVGRLAQIVRAEAHK
jgi:hypothetical protein